jgi:hypothetical protein
MFLRNFNQDGELDIPSLYWIPKLHNCPNKQRYIDGFIKFSTNTFSKLATSIQSAIKTGFQIYCDTSYPKGCVNQMSILKSLTIC